MPRAPDTSSSQFTFQWLTSVEEFQRIVAENPQELYKMMTPQFARTEPSQSTSYAQVAKSGKSDFSKTMLPKDTKSYQYTGKPGHKYRKSDSGKQLTASPSESDADSVSRRTHKRDSMTYTQGSIITELPQEPETPLLILTRPAKRGTEIKTPSSHDIPRI